MRRAPGQLMTLCVLLFPTFGLAANAEAPSAEEKKPDQLTQAWTDLADSSAPAMLKALLVFADHPDEAVPFLEKRLQSPSPRQIAKWLTELDARGFDDRLKAQEQLAQIADLIAPQLQKALDDRPSLEMRFRLEELLDPQGSGPVYQARLRAVRAIAVLEHIGTPKARRVLENVGGDGRNADKRFPEPSMAEEGPEPVAGRQSAWSRAESRSYAAARAVERLERKDRRDDNDLAVEFMSSDTGPAARAFLALTRKKAMPPESRDQATRVLLHLAESIMTGPVAVEDPLAQAPICPWLELLSVIGPEGDHETELRKAVRSAATLLKQSHQLKLHTSASAVVREKKAERDAEIEAWQREAALVQYRLEQVREELEELQADLRDESVFWQAAAASMAFHISARERFLHIYNYSLARVRRGDLPELDPEVATGWRLVATEKIPINDLMEKYMRSSYRALAQKHPGSLWEAMAFQEMTTRPGLDWIVELKK